MASMRVLEFECTVCLTFCGWGKVESLRQDVETVPETAPTRPLDHVQASACVSGSGRNGDRGRLLV